MFFMLLFVLFISSYIPVVKTFNLDIISPGLRTGPSKSLFGFAVVSSSTKQQWAYVGAPRALLTRQRSSIVSSNSTETIPVGRVFGNIFECPNGTDECRPILIENELSQAMPSFHTVLDDAWLGSSLIATSDDSLVTCGYRLMRNISIDRYDTRGACFKVSSDHQDVSYYDFCEQSSETELLHEGSALCQSGLSLAYIPSGGRSDIIAFGEPGAFQWSGRIEADYSDTLLRQLYAYKSASSTPLPYSYLGYSVLIIKSKSRDINDRSYIFIASAPRASNGRGEIRFYTKRFVSTNNFGYDTLQTIFQINNNHSMPYVLIGEQLGSYFGYAMTAGDLNGDGHTDLVISAPFYYSKKPSYGGAVYIYYGLNGKFSNDRRQILFEPPIHSRFGFSVACIPDLNKDGIDDLAISAPGEKDDIHTGSVYIYLGSRKNELAKHTQKIVPSQLLINLKQTTIINDFGFSLATQSPFKYSSISTSSSTSIVSSNSTIIIDYPSLIIGIPKADMIVHLRSHPLVNVNVRIENMKELQAIRYSSENRPCKTIDGTPVVCFDVRLCFDSNDKLAQNLIIIYTLTADALSTIRRILSTVNHLPTITNKQVLNTCENQTFITKSGNDDFLTPIHFSLVYNISQDRNDLRGKPFILEGSITLSTFCSSRRCRLIDDVRLNDEWENGKILLYLVEEPIVEISSTLTSTGTKIDGQCERLPQWRDHIRILDLLNRTSSINRQRRDEQNVDSVIDPKTSLTVTITPPTSSSNIRTLTLTCDPTYQNVRCYPIHCHIKSLSAQSYYFIKLRARLWNSTLIENYFDTYDRVDIQSYASIHINDLLIFQTSTDNDNATATTAAEFANRSDKIIVPRLPLWVPLVGAMAGLILLVFIVIVCCLLGFFQRTKAPPLKKKPTTLTLDGTTTNSSSDEHQRILLRQTYRQPILIPSSTTNSFNDENYHSQQTTIPLIHSIPEVPSADNHDQDIDEDEEDDELIQNNLGNQSDIEEEARFPVEDDDDDEYSSKMNERLVDGESINQ
ncbi:unnamed protein product [Rotaria sp. Silwood2]|nr:unnamed protein product [Rotaria sp. Silwood2]